MSKTQHLVGRTLRQLGYTGGYAVYGPVTDQESYEERVKMVVGIDETDTSIMGPSSIPYSEFEPKYTEIKNAYPMELLRVERDKRLVESDWTQNPDVPEATRNAWTAYRQELRDLPATATPTLNSNEDLDQNSVVWPSKPL